LTGTKKSAELPDASVLASMSIDTVKIDRLVREYFTAQPLKILPQAPFVDAVSQFVEKDDKHAMEMFVMDSLTGQVKQLLELDDDEEDLDSVMDRIREKQEEGFLSGAIKRTKKGKYKPRPPNWDSDLDGEWEDQPGALIIDDNEPEEEDETPAPPVRRGRVVMSDEEVAEMAPPARKTATKRAPAKKAPAKPAAKAPAKKAPAKAPVRGRKKAIPVLSDDEDDDVIMMDQEPPLNAQPRRAAATRATGRQTTLNFSQSQPRTQTQRMELSDDEISDEDDAFEPVPASSSRRR
jgi:double-strand break repair protein MRE11